MTVADRFADQVDILWKISEMAAASALAKQRDVGVVEEDTAMRWHRKSGDHLAEQGLA